MKKFSKIIVKHRIAILIIMSILVILSGVAFFFVKINSDMISYLPQNKPTKQGLDFLIENFGMKGDAIVGVNGLSEENVEKLVLKMEKVDGVRKQGGVLWYGAIKKINNDPMVKPIVGSIEENQKLIKLLHPKIDDANNCYVLMVFLDVPSSSTEATAALNKIGEEIDSMKELSTTGNFSYSFGGSAAITRDIFNSVFGEIWKFMLVGLLVVFFILLITTTSIIEPFILLITLGASIILNMGSNIIFGEISTVTMSISALLQLGLSMDYAIFLIHAFYRERKKTLDDMKAMERAVTDTFSTVFSSALTTVFGFIALFFMQFTMGVDLGRVLAKGVFLSMLTVVLLQPALILLFRRPLGKYSHKILVPRFQATASFSVKHKLLLTIIAALLLIPSVVMQGKVDYSYMEMGLTKQNPTKLEQHVNMIGNTVVAVVPVKNGIDNLEGQRRFSNDILKIENVENIMGLYTMLPENNIVVDGFVSRNLTTSDIFSQMVRKDKNGTSYVVYSIMMKNGVIPESKEALDVLDNVNKIINNYFGKSAKEKNPSTYLEYNGEPVKTYTTGTAQSVKDLADITPKDFKIVSIVSVLSIFIILLLTLKSFKLSALLIAVIELGIFINLSLVYMMGVKINFMAYIVISAVQLGATVDYAILYTLNYKRRKMEMGSNQAAYQGMIDSGMSIITSASIIAGACFSVTIIAKNLIIKQLTMLIGRGAIISAVLVIVFLPAILSLLSRGTRIPKEMKYMRGDGLIVKINNWIKHRQEIKQLKLKQREDEETYDYLQDDYT